MSLEDPRPVTSPPSTSPRRNGAPLYGSTHDDASATPVDQEAEQKRSIGVVSAVFIIFNRIIGTGIFATPSTILRFSGSIGLSLTLWLVGAVIAAAGMQVYIFWGSALPRNGGEKNYLEYLFPRPQRLITSIYASTAILLAHAAGNSLVFAEYTLASLYPSALTRSSSSNRFLSPVRVIAFGCLSTALVLHGVWLNAGLRVQNALGATKILILFIMISTGWLAFTGRLQPGIEPPTPFASWDTIWEGTNWGKTVICSALYNVIYSYIGFSNANYALAEMKDPIKTLRIAGPLAIISVSLFYFLCNLAYFSAVPKEDITGSGRLVASLLFRNVWGDKGERILSGFVALSALGNVLSVIFSQGRVNRALAIEGVLPWSKLWASTKPFGAPLAGLSLQWFVCVLVVFIVPSGDAYNFVLNVVSYPIAVVNAIIAFGLIYVAYTNLRKRGYLPLLPHSTPLASESTPLKDRSLTPLSFKFKRALVIPAVLFGLANIFLIVVPFTRPPPGLYPYEHLPYWTHAVGGWVVFLVGALWWLMY